ncbi:unnamed protein product [Urochloa humidicola]
MVEEDRPCKPYPPSTPHLIYILLPGLREIESGQIYAMEEANQMVKHEFIPGGSPAMKPELQKKKLCWATLPTARRAVHCCRRRGAGLAGRSRRRELLVASCCSVFGVPSGGTMEHGETWQVSQRKKIQ